jgi:flagellar motility protein MotE (MotC chaperone)
VGELKMQLAAMEAKKVNIERKIEGVLALESDLEVERKTVADSRNELTNYLDRIEKGLEETDKERLKRISKLAKLYNSMKPQEAASIASSLKVELLVEIISEMKERKAAGLMESLPPVLASTISRKLGERKAK